MREAQRLGMNGTTFRNPNGLPAEGQYSTARDLAVLARATWMQFPEYRDYFGITAIRAGNKVLRSYNTPPRSLPRRQRDEDGLRLRLGFNVVATRRPRTADTLIAVVLGDTSAAARAETAAGLLNRGFNGGLGGLMGQNLNSFRFPAVARAAREPP